MHSPVGVSFHASVVSSFDEKDRHDDFCVESTGQSQSSPLLKTSATAILFSITVAVGATSCTEPVLPGCV